MVATIVIHKVEPKSVRQTGVNDANTQSTGPTSAAHTESQKNLSLRGSVLNPSATASNNVASAMRLRAVTECSTDKTIFLDRSAKAQHGPLFYGLQASKEMVGFNCNEL